MNAESEGEKMYLDKWRVAIRNLKNSLFSYPNTAQSCFPDPITDDTVFYCVQGLVYGSQKFPDGKFIRSSPGDLGILRGRKAFCQNNKQRL